MISAIHAFFEDYADERKGLPAEERVFTLTPKDVQKFKRDSYHDGRSLLKETHKKRKGAEKPVRLSSDASLRDSGAKIFGVDSPYLPDEIVAVRASN